MYVAWHRVVRGCLTRHLRNQGIIAPVVAHKGRICYIQRCILTCLLKSVLFYIEVVFFTLKLCTVALASIAPILQSLFWWSFQHKQDDYASTELVRAASSSLSLSRAVTTPAPVSSMYSVIFYYICSIIINIHYTYVWRTIKCPHRQTGKRISESIKVADSIIRRARL